MKLQRVDARSCTARVERRRGTECIYVCWRNRLLEAVNLNRAKALVGEDASLIWQVQEYLEMHGGTARWKGSLLDCTSEMEMSCLPRTEAL